MANSRYIAGLAGPTFLTLSATEAINVHIWASNTAAGVYFNGAVLFVVGLAIIRAHNIWKRDWTVMVTLVGWSLLLLGLFRMIAPELQLEAAKNTTSILFELIFPFSIGVFLTYHAYRRE